MRLSCDIITSGEIILKFKVCIAHVGVRNICLISTIIKMSIVCVIIRYCEWYRQNSYLLYTVEVMYINLLQYAFYRVLIVYSVFFPNISVAVKRECCAVFPTKYAHESRFVCFLCNSLVSHPGSWVTLCFQFVSAASAAATTSASHIKPFELNPRYLGQRIYRSVEMSGWPFLDLDPRSRLWHRLAKICLSAR